MEQIFLAIQFLENPRDIRIIWFWSISWENKLYPKRPPFAIWETATIKEIPTLTQHSLCFTEESLKDIWRNSWKFSVIHLMTTSFAVLILDRTDCGSYNRNHCNEVRLSRKGFNRGDLMLTKPNRWECQRWVWQQRVEQEWLTEQTCISGPQRAATWAANRKDGG